MARPPPGRSSPFDDIRAWQRAFARWSDLVAVTALTPPTPESGYHEWSAVGQVTLMNLSNEAFVMATLAYVFVDDHGSRIGFNLNGPSITGSDPEEAVFRIVEVARRATPPSPVYRTRARKA